MDWCDPLPNHGATSPDGPYMSPNMRICGNLDAVNHKILGPVAALPYRPMLGHQGPRFARPLTGCSDGERLAPAPAGLRAAEHDHVEAFERG